MHSDSRLTCALLICDYREKVKNGLIALYICTASTLRSAELLYRRETDKFVWEADWKLISWKLHSSSGVHTIMTSTGLVFHMLVESKYPLTKEVLSQMLELKLETEEESSMALELIKFVRHQLEEFEDSNDDDHGEEERV
ncbi:hypothetical protein Tco_0487490 [Tanacetum coccineum]